jgi:hypothetical protein
MTNNAKFMVVIGVPDLIGGTFFGTFESEASASEWGETNYPTTRETGRQWQVTTVHPVDIPPYAKSA